jgi:hypothetical protein
LFVQAASVVLMKPKSWRYVTTKHDDTWMKGGMTCHHILNGMGSECSSF